MLIAAELVAIFFAGGPRQGGMGIFLLLAGLVMVFIRPVRPVAWLLWFLGFLVIVATCLALLPPGYFGLPAWREGLGGIKALHLPDQLSLDPLATMFWIVLLGGSVFLAIYCLSLSLSHRSIERVASLMVLACSLYAMVAWIAWQTGWNFPFFHKEEWMQSSYGFFPNRNHTAGFLITGTIVSLGLIHRGMNGGGLLSGVLGGGALALLSPMLLVFSKSRGGLVFLLLGILIWIAGLGRHRSRLLIAGTLFILLFTAFLFVGSGSELLQRLNPRPSTLQASSDGPLLGSEAAELKSASLRDLGHDTRILIWEDSLHMIRDFPISGSGLGTYASIYPFYALKSFGDKRIALHAESDWITLGVEGGIPALLLALVCVAVLSLRIPRLARLSGSNWPLRWAILAAFFAELLHGFVDVPLHKPELGWWILLLGAVGFSPIEDGGEKKNITLRVQRVVFIIIGLSLFLIGALLIRAQWLGGMAFPPFAPAFEQKRILELYGQGDEASVGRAIEESRKAISMYPACHPLYYQLAVLELYARGDNPVTKELFQAERSLVPRDTELIAKQAFDIAPYDTALAAKLWSEALNLQLESCRSPFQKDVPYARAIACGIFQSMVSAAEENPDLLPALPPLALLDPELRMIWMSSKSCDPSQIAIAAADATFLNALTVKQQGRFFELWSRRGDNDNDKAGIAAFLDANPQYQRAAIQTTASLLAASGRSEQACRLLIDTFSIPMPASKKDDGMIRAGDSDVPSDPLEAARYYMERGNDLSVRRLLAEALRSGGGGVDGRDALLLRAQLEVRSGNWKSALDSLISYLRATKRL